MNGLLSAGVGLLCVLVGLGVWLGWQLLRQNGRILLRLDELEKRLDELELGEPEEPAGLPIGSDAPEFELPDLAGTRQRLAQYRGRPVLLIFFNPACGFCRDLGLKLAALHPGPEIRGRNSDADQSRSREAASAATVEPKLLLIISTGDAARNLEFFREHKVTGPVLLQKDMEVAAAYKTNGTPTGYLIDAEGKIASDLAIGAEALLALIDSPPRQRPFTPALSLSDAESEKPSQNADQRTTRFGNRSLAHSKIKRDGLKAGTPAPGFRLPRLDGGELSLDELRGR